MKLLDNISNDLKVSIAESISTGINTTISDVVENFDLTPYQATELLNDTIFCTMISKMSKAKAKLSFHSNGLDRLIEISKGENEKAALAAIKMVMEYTGEVVRKGGDVNVNVSLESHIREQEESEKVVGSKSIVDILTPKSLPVNMGNPIDDFDIDELGIKSSNDLNFIEKGNNVIHEFIN